MPRFAANVSMMFNEVPFLDRFAAAADAGFRAVEFLFPYEFPPEEIAPRLQNAKLENVLFNLPPGNTEAGERGLASLPGRQADFRASVDTAIPYALAFGTPRLHVMAGVVPPGADRAAHHATYVENLRYVAARLGEHGITALIEPINTRDIPGFFLSYQADADAVCAAVDSPHLKMQMDCYHMQIMEGDLSTKLRRYAARCGHIQIAGVPKRHEPSLGEVNYPAIFELLDEIGYTGWIGCEYRPAGKTQDGLGWVRPWL
jgi:hydroxypyruvate isomerase